MRKIVFMLVFILAFNNDIRAQYGPRLMQLDGFMLQMNQAMMQQQWNNAMYGPQVPQVDWGEVFKNSGESSSTSAPETSQSNNRSSQDRSQSSRNSTTQRKCSYCKNGRILHESSVPSYGMTPYKKKCNECGFVYMSTTSHSHSSCSHCGGSGYINY